jgi:RNA polymerase sigma factor (sigma-70 family)
LSVEPNEAVADDVQSDPLDALYRSQYTRAVQLAHLLIGSNDVAEDIAQEAFLRMRPKLAGIERPEAYLTTTVTHLCWNWHRTRSRDRIRHEAVMSTAPVATESSHEHLLAIVDQLPFRQRTVLVARYWLDLSEAEIARLLGCRPGTVKSLAARALRALRKELS